MINSHTISLNNFEGPLDLLLYLIQRNEIDIHNIPLHSITSQFLEKMLPQVDVGAEFLGNAATLFLLKSQRLLPKLDNEQKEDDDSQLLILQGLIEYCTLKDTAKQLASYEESERFHFPREHPNEPGTPIPALPHLSLNELQALFEKLMARKPKEPLKISETSFLVSERIEYLQGLLACSDVSFAELFSKNASKDELIATFLALLQLMKQGFLIVTSDLQLCKRP